MLKENYIISRSTNLIKNEKEKVIIYVNEYTINYNDSLIKLLDESCLYYGSSYKGRVKSSKKILNIKYKVPFMLNNNLYFFPIGVINNDYALINYNNINNYYLNNFHKLVVIFKNGDSILFDVSISSFERQMLRCSRLANIIENRSK